MLLHENEREFDGVVKDQS